MLFGTEIARVGLILILPLKKDYMKKVMVLAMAVSFVLASQAQSKSTKGSKFLKPLKDQAMCFFTKWVFPLELIKCLITFHFLELEVELT